MAPGADRRWLLRAMRGPGPRPTLAALPHLPAGAMPTPDPSARIDLYAPVHKALRLAMCATLVRLGRTEADDANELLAALADTEALLGLLRRHLEQERSVLHPAIEARRPGGAAPIAAEHEEHRQRLEALADDVTALRRGAPVHRARGLQRLYRHLALFIAENLVHMNSEETQLNQALWACYSDEELARLQARLGAAMPPDEGLRMMRWVAATAAPRELAVLLAELRGQAPAFDAAMAVLRQVLEPDRLARLQLALAG